MATSSNPSFVKRALTGHSWIGLLSGAFMYLICLSGTLAVLYQEFERWEQPYVDEYSEYDIATVATAFREFAAANPEQTDHFHIVFPDSGIPRVVVENDHVAQFVSRDGTLGALEKSAWTTMLLRLHLYLHLPETFGMILVSIFGALLCSLIISGFLAHKRIFKDAFRFRRGGNPQLEQADLHNRLSVWAAPFHIMIAITGAYFGLSSLIVVTAAAGFHGGDRDAVIGLAFGSEPELSQEIRLADVGAALENFKEVAPERSKPIFLTVHEPGTEGQFIEIYATEPSRLIYSENYRFDVKGLYLGRDGVSDGEIGRQFIYSIYRLHFGHFGGFAVKILYFFLGLSLTVISVTGINIWLAKRKNHDYINDLWVGFVWSTPIGFTLSAIAQTLFGLSATLFFWLCISVGCAYSFWLKNDVLARKHLLATLSLSLFSLVLIYWAHFGEAAYSTIGLASSALFIIMATGFGLVARRKPL